MARTKMAKLFAPIILLILKEASSIPPSLDAMYENPIAAKPSAIERNLLSKKEREVTIASLHEFRLHVEKYCAAIQRIEDEKGPDPMLQYFQPMFLAFKRIMLLRTQSHIGGGISNIPPPRDNEGNEQFPKENANP